MRRAKTTHTPYFPSAGELIWLRWDNGAGLLAHSSGLRPALVLSSDRSQEQNGTVTVVPLLGSSNYCEGAIALPFDMYTCGYIKLCVPEVMDCFGDQVSPIEMCPAYFVEKVKGMLGVSFN